MKNLLLSLSLLTCMNAVNAQMLTFDVSAKYAYSATAMFNKNISDLGASQDYDVAFSQNYGAALSVNYKFIGVGAELMFGNFVSAYQGGETVASSYNSNVKLTTTQIPLYLRLGGEEGSFSEFGVVMNNVRSATYSYASALIDPPATNDVTDEYQNFLGYMFGFGARMKLKKIPLAVSLSSRFMYSPNDAGGVDAMGTSLSIYPAEYKTNAASVGIHFGMVYLIH
jgi:hypothetical protein